MVQENKVMVHLVPGQDRPTQDGPLTEQLEKEPTVMPGAEVLASPRPPCLNKQRKDSRRRF